MQANAAALGGAADCLFVRQNLAVSWDPKTTDTGRWLKLRLARYVFPDVQITPPDALGGCGKSDTVRGFLDAVSTLRNLRIDGLSNLRTFVEGPIRQFVNP